MRALTTYASPTNTSVTGRSPSFGLSATFGETETEFSPELLNRRSVHPSPVRVARTSRGKSSPRRGHLRVLGPEPHDPT
jgi:hypothetical protein